VRHRARRRRDHCERHGEALSQALREEYGGDKSWVWVRDFDDATVWFEHETPDESGTYAQGCQLDDDGMVTLDGDRI
jgi:hypothetical protein